MPDPIPANANLHIVEALDALTCNQDYEVEVVSDVVHIVRVLTIKGSITFSMTLIEVK